MKISARVGEWLVLALKKFCVCAKARLCVVRLAGDDLLPSTRKLKDGELDVDLKAESTV